MTRRPSALALVAILLIGASPAAADWLVTREGGRVETKGPWQVKGKLIVFTGIDGALASLRLGEVNLDASSKATAEAKARAEAPTAPAPPKKKLAVLTDDNFHKAAATASAKPAEASAAPAPAAEAGPVAVSSWKRVESRGGDGIEIQGTLHNETDTLVVNVAVEVQLYNEAGDRVGTAAAVLPSNALQPRATADFSAKFPDVFAFTSVKFEPQGLPLDLAPAAEEKPPEQNPP